MASSRLLVLIFCLGVARAQASPCDGSLRRIVICRPEASLAQCRAAISGAGWTPRRDLPSIHAVAAEIPGMPMFTAQAESDVSLQAERVDDDLPVHWLMNIPGDDLIPADAGNLVRRIRDLGRKKSESGSSEDIPWGVARVDAPAAWTRTQGENTPVAVIDSGIDATHPDLAGQVVGGFNALDPERPDTWQDDEGHGTHVAGTIAAKRDGAGVVGVAPKARLYAVKVLDKNGNASYSDVIAGIEWASAHGIKVANMSLGAPRGSEPLHRAVQAALAAGMTIVAAAGNTGGPVSYPGAYPEVIAVSASDSNNRLSPFSSRGPEVAFIAPGKDILSTKMGGGYITLSGTSMAAPHVSGLAALAVSAGASSPQAVRAMLESGARHVAGLPPEAEGRGMILAGEMLHQGPSEGPLFASRPE